MNADEAVTGRLATAGELPLMTPHDPDDALDVGRGLLAAGIGVLEVALRSESGLQAIAALRRELPDLLVGVGTVLTAAQLRAARDAGAEFGLAPGFDPALIATARELGMPFFPGVATPSEVTAALATGCRVLKVFPAGDHGPAGLERLAAPFRHLGPRWIPSGGITADSAADYRAVEGVLAVAGSWRVDEVRAEVTRRGR